MAYNFHHDTRKRTSSAAEAYHSTTSPRHSAMTAIPARPSMSSDRYSYQTATPKQQKRKSRRETDHQSIMSSRASETSQATRTSRLRKRDRPPAPPPKDIKYTSFTPAMTTEEDARSEILAFKNKLRSGLSRIVKVFTPGKSKLSQKADSPSSSPNHSFESSEVSQYSRW